MVQTPASNQITHHPVSRLLPLLPRQCHHSPSRFLFRPQPSAHHITAHHHSPVAHLSLTPSQHQPQLQGNTTFCQYARTRPFPPAKTLSTHHQHTHPFSEMTPSHNICLNIH
ncbi:hypothetical protein PCASD_08715 [Puccinia coronata f. sp. avenae]|uniref:Uncharacterized protein n=1 Tax=Puccinia coronata f. sp. avenae TaxID=200324 RepID=A0A2N5UG50_9BASI|nr:hypothetical protein PCASD_08715 [Puccinia coronata f. sp. avenae]